MSPQYNSSAGVTNQDVSDFGVTPTLYRLTNEGSSCAKLWKSEKQRKAGIWFLQVVLVQSTVRKEWKIYYCKLHGKRYANINKTIFNIKDVTCYKFVFKGVSCSSIMFISQPSYYSTIKPFYLPFCGVLILIFLAWSSCFVF